MEFGFDPEEWERLDVRERVQRCRAFAEQCRTLSRDAPREVKRTYLELSLEWIALADEIERYGR